MINWNDGSFFTIKKSTGEGQFKELETWHTTKDGLQVTAESSPVPLDAAQAAAAFFKLCLSL